MLTIYTTIYHELTLTELSAQVMEFSHSHRQMTLRWKLPNGSFRIGIFDTKNGKCVAGECTGGWRLNEHKNPTELRIYTDMVKLKQAKSRKRKEKAAAATSKIVKEVIANPSKIIENDEEATLHNARLLKKGVLADV